MFKKQTIFGSGSRINFERGHYGEHLYGRIMKLSQWVWR